MTRNAPVPSRPAATTAKAMLGPVVASAGFVGVVRGSATAGVEDGLAGVPVAVTVLVVAVVAGADGVDVAAAVVGGAAGAEGVVSAVGVDGVASGVGCGAWVSAGGVLFVDGGVSLVVVGGWVVVVDASADAERSPAGGCREGERGFDEQFHTSARNQ